MTTYETLKLEREDGTAVLTLTRPPVNALGRRLVEELGAAAAALEADPSLRAVIVAAEGKAFCAGADLKERQSMNEEDVRRWVPFLGGTFTHLARCPFRRSLRSRGRRRAEGSSLRGLRSRASPSGVKL